MAEYIVDYELIPLKWREGYGLSDVDLTEEVVRCRDCAYSFDSGSRCRKWRTQDCFENSIPEHVEPDGFCAWGKRKEGGDD